ncbi:MAG: helix-turn-helix domain-containing protein [Rhodospirillales bacterium]|nr:helix-turn-helix domain-containing protein [Rhodospirillales bacterium]
MGGLAVPRRPVFARLDGFSEAALSAFLPTSSSQHVQIGQGRLRGEIGLLPLDRAAIRRVNFTVDMRFAATLQPDAVNLVFPNRTPAGARVLGAPVRQGMVLAVDAGTSTDARVGAGIDWIGLRLPRADFQRAWSALSRRDPPWRRGFLATSPPDAAGAALADTLAAVDAFARRTPALFDDPVWRRNVERAVADRYVTTLMAGVEAAAARREDGPVANAMSVVRAVDGLLDAAAEPARNITGICIALGIGRRTLERAFADVLGVGPKEYLQLRALRAAREDLLDPAVIDETVTTVAIRHGFWHLGRFSVNYHALFAETPSETRRRTVERARPARIARWFDMGPRRVAAPTPLARRRAPAQR